MPSPTRVYVFKDPTVITRWAKGLLYAGIAVSVLGIISNLLERQLLGAMLSGVFESRAALIQAADASDGRQSAVGILYFVWFLLTAVVVLMWVYRANNNAHALGAEQMRFTPGWAVGWYFIPIFTLWKPYQAMKEIWKASAEPRDWQDQPRPSLLPWWWFFWIASNILSQVYTRLGQRAEEIDQLMNVNMLGIVAYVSDIPNDLFLIAIIGGIYQMQMRHHAAAPKTDAPTTDAPTTDAHETGAREASAVAQTDPPGRAPTVS